MISINIKPVYERNGIEYPFECTFEKYWFCSEYRFSVDVLRNHFGDELSFEYDHGIFKIQLDDIRDLHILRNIYDDTNQYPLREELYDNGTHVKFEIISYSFDD